jgi:hypothetical protein
VDTITPAGPATINALISPTVGYSTLNAFDSIKATGTGNTLNIVDQTTAGTPSTIPTITVSDVQTANIQSTTAESVNTTSWAGLTALNVTASTGADVITAAGTTAVTVTDTLASAASAPAATTIDGGSTVNLTATGATSSTNVVIGNITVGGTTAPTGNVTITATETSGVAASTFGNISATGAAGVTVNSTQNVAFTDTAVTAGTISATGGTGAIVINSDTNVTSATAAGATVYAAAVNATGGSSITVSEVVTASAAALAGQTTAASTVTEGAVTVLDGGTATTVTVNQMAPATAAAATPATPVSATAAVPGGPGYSAVPSVVTAAAALVPATLGIANGTVTVAGASTGIALANASSTITAVTLSNYAAGSYINSSALTSITLSGEGDGLTVYNDSTIPFTALALNLNGLTDTTGITSGKVKILNVTTGGTTGSTLGAAATAGYFDTSLATLNVAGTQTLSLGMTTAADAALKTIAVTGSAGFNDLGTFALLTTAGAAITTTSSGTITATLHSAGTDTFTGSTGRDVITITADQTKAVTVTAAGSELVLANTAATFQSGATHTWGNVSGFTTLGLTSASSGVFNAGLMGSNTINAVDVQGLLAATTVTNVAQNASLSVDTSITGFTGALVYQSVDASSSDVVTVNLGTTTGGHITLGNAAGDTGASLLLSSLTMENANNVGIGTLNIVSNDTAANVATGGFVNTIVALADSGLANLNVSGVDGLTITTLNEGTTAIGGTATAATSFSINNTSGGVVTVGTLTDSALGSLTFTGTGNSVISTLTGQSGHVLAIANTGTGTATVSTFAADTALTSLTLTGNVALNGDGSLLPASAAQGAATTGVTVAAGTDNAHINLNLVGAGAALTDSITVGNANNFITDGSTAGTVNVIVGTGSNAIVLGGTTTDTTGAYNVTLGAHTAATGIDSISVGIAGTNFATVPNLIVTGAVTGDVITLAGDNNLFVNAGLTLGVGTITATTITSAATTVAQAIGQLVTAVGSTIHDIAAGVYNGNTYIVEINSAAVASTTNATVIELVGSHTLAATAAGSVHLAS